METGPADHASGRRAILHALRGAGGNATCGSTATSVMSMTLVPVGPVRKTPPSRAKKPYESFRTRQEAASTPTAAPTRDRPAVREGARGVGGAVAAVRPGCKQRNAAYALPGESRREREFLIAATPSVPPQRDRGLAPGDETRGRRHPQRGRERRQAATRLARLAADGVADAQRRESLCTRGPLGRGERVGEARDHVGAHAGEGRRRPASVTPGARRARRPRDARGPEPAAPPRCRGARPRRARRQSGWDPVRTGPRRSRRAGRRSRPRPPTPRCDARPAPARAGHPRPRRRACARC